MKTSVAITKMTVKTAVSSADQKPRVVTLDRMEAEGIIIRSFILPGIVHKTGIHSVIKVPILAT